MCLSQEEGKDDGHASDSTHEVIDLAEDDESLQSAKKNNQRREKTHEDDGMILIRLMKVLMQLRMMNL